MKKLTLLLLLFTYSVYASENYLVDTKSSNVYYKATSDVLFFGTDEIIGINKNISGYINKDEKSLQGEIIIDVAGFETQNDTRDEHVREILNFTNYKYIQFNIDSKKTIQGQLYFIGKLIVNNISKQIKLLVIEKKSDTSIIYSGKLKVKYSDFGIKTPTLGAFIKKAKEDIEIGAKITFIKEK